MDGLYNNSKLDDVVVAVDVGTTKISVLAVRLNEFNKLEVLASSVVESEGVVRGVVSNIEKTSNNIKEAIRMVEDKLKTKVKKVYVGIAGMAIKSIRNKGIITRSNSNDEISSKDVEALKNDMQKMVLPPGDKILHVIPQEFTVDNERGIDNPIGMPGVRLEAEFLIITGPMMSIQNTYKCFEKAGVKIAKMVLEPIASAESVLSKEEKEAGVALVDIGGGTTDLTIYTEDIIRHAAIIPIGGNIITKDIKEGCTVMIGQAEKMKMKFGSALADEVLNNRIITIPGHKGRESKEISERNLSLIIQARMEEILDYVYMEIRKSGLENSLTCGIVLTGGGSKLQNIDILAQYHTGLTTRIGYPVDNLAHGYPEDLSDARFSTAIGLVSEALYNPNPIYGLERSELNQVGCQQKFEFAEVAAPVKEEKIQAVQTVNKVEVVESKADKYIKEMKQEDQKEKQGGSAFFKKIFDSAKDFFEGNPNSDLK